MLSALKNKVFNVLSTLECYGLKNTWSIQKGLAQNTSIKIDNTLMHFRDNAADTDVFREVWLKGVYDFHLTIPIKTIMDCGANIGLTTLWFKSRYPEAKILSIEPEQSNFKMLQKNADNDPSIYCINSGIWIEDTELFASEKLRNNEFRLETEAGTNTASIKVRSILSLMAEYQLSEIDILKIDIEGAEKELFEQGSDAWLTQTKVLMIEFHDAIKPGCSKSVFTALAKHGFELNGEFNHDIKMHRIYTLCFVNPKYLSK